MIGIQQRQHLNCLSKPHVVGETPAEAETPEKEEPPKTLTLIRAKLSVKCGRRVGGPNTAKTFQFLPHPMKTCVESRCGFAGQQSVEQSCLMRGKTQSFAAAFSSETGSKAVSLNPFFGNNAERSIAELHDFFTACTRFQKLRHLDRVTIEIGSSLQFKPVDSRTDMHAEFAVPPV